MASVLNLGMPELQDVKQEFVYTVHFGSFVTKIHLPTIGGDSVVLELQSGLKSFATNKEESRELQETEEEEEDSLSTTSTIEYHYTEEEYDPNEYYDDEDYTDDEDYEEVADEEDQHEDDDQDEVGVTYPTAMEESRHEAQNYTMVSGWGSRTFSKGSPDKDEPLSNEWPDKDEWVASWKQKDEPQYCLTWINVYAYFDNNHGYGGYGVILRNAFVKPIVAAANFSRKGRSFYCQVFMGIKSGVALAEEHGLSGLHVQCNSASVPLLFRDVRDCSDNECIRARDPSKICEQCFNVFDCDMNVVPLVVELRGKKLVAYFSSSWGSNAAAHYLAKREKRNRRHDHQVEEEEEEERIIAPDDFPPELKNILWNDAFGLAHFRVPLVA